MNNKFNRVLSIALAIMMVCGLFVTGNVYALDNPQYTVTGVMNNGNLVVSIGVLNLDTGVSGGYFTLKYDTAKLVPLYFDLEDTQQWIECTVDTAVTEAINDSKDSSTTLVGNASKIALDKGNILITWYANKSSQENDAKDLLNPSATKRDFVNIRFRVKNENFDKNLLKVIPAGNELDSILEGTGVSDGPASLVGSDDTKYLIDGASPLNIAWDYPGSDIEPAATAVILADGSLGQAGDKKITDLTAGHRYKVTVDKLVYPVLANGTLGKAGEAVDYESLAPLTGTEITGLVNGTTYMVEEVVPFNLNKTVIGGKATVILTSDGKEVSAAAAGQKITVSVSDVADDQIVDSVQVCADQTTATAIKGVTVKEIKSQSTYEFDMPAQDVYVVVTLKGLEAGVNKVMISSSSALPDGVNVDVDPHVARVGDIVTITITGVGSDYLVNTVDVKTSSGKSVAVTPSAVKTQLMAAGEIKYSFAMPDEPVTIKVDVAKMPVVAAPTADPKAGAVEKGTKVSLSSATAGSKIYYTTDGKEPTVASTLYDSSKPIEIKADTTIKALAVHDNMISSKAEFKYSIVQVATPVASPKGGKVKSGTLIALTTDTKDAKIYYTTDGSNPTASSKLYEEKIKIEKAVTIKAVAVRENYKDSDIMSESYKITTDSGSSSGGSSSSSSSGTTKRTSSFKAPEFIDLTGYSWAAPYINALAEKRIIKGTSDTTFGPAANIKRADYMVLLVRMLGLSGDVSNNFSDVTADKYYFNEVGVAKSLGLVTGTGDNKFNPESPISRQDMFVIAERLLKLKGVQLPNDTKSLDDFSDNTVISDYARTAIANMVSLGLVKGSNGAINPLGNASRAETAVFLYRIGDMLGIV